VLMAQPGVDLLLTDMVMPGGMTGATLAAEARVLRAGLAVVVASGYAAPESLGELPEGAAWLRKPHAAADLARALRQALDQGRGGATAAQ
jgi:CheY-like chemotaxis protein